MPERTTHFRSLFRPLFPLFLLSLAVSSRLRFSTDSADTFPPNRSFSPIAISANISLEYESLWLKRGTVLLLPKSNSFFFSHLNERSIHSLLFLFFFLRDACHDTQNADVRSFTFAFLSLPPRIRIVESSLRGGHPISNRFDLRSIVFQISGMKRIGVVVRRPND